jgi:WD40 repeat protein
LRSTPTGDTSALAFSRDSRWLAAGNGGGHFLLDSATLQRPAPAVQGDGAHSVAFSPDGQLLAVATIFGRVSLWSIATNDEVAVFHHPDSSGGAIGRNLRVAFSPDGTALVAAGGQTVLSWGLATATERRVLYGPQSTVEGLAFHPEGRLLAVAHGAKRGGDATLTLWDVSSSTGDILNQVTGLDALFWAEFHPDGTLLATCDGQALKLRDVPSLRERTEPIPLGAVGQALKLRDAPSLRERTEPIPLGAVGQSCVAFSPDGSIVAASGGGYGLGVWILGHIGPGRDARSGLSLERIGREPGGPSPYLCFSPDGMRIAWVDDFRTVRLWDVARRRAIPFRGPALFAGWQSLGFLRDGRHLVMITQDRAAEVWDVGMDAGRRTFTLGGPGEFAKSQVALSPNGRWFAGDHTTSAVAVWDVERRRRLFVLPEENAPIAHLTWGPDSSTLAVGMKDGRVILWNVPQIRARLAELGLDW